MKNATVVTAVIRKNYRTGAEFIDLNSLVEGSSNSPANAMAKTARYARLEVEWDIDNPIVRTSPVVVGEVTAKQILTRRY